MKKWLLILSSCNLLFNTDIKAEKHKVLRCDQVANAIANLPSISVRPYCETAEIRCHAQEIMLKLDPKDPMRQFLEPKLNAQVNYELAVCSMAIDKVDPSYLNNN